MKIERRNFAVTMEQTDEGKIVGYAAVIGRESRDLGGFVEIIEPGAFDGTDFSEAAALFNHNNDLVLGRVHNRTLTISVDANGIKYTIDPPDTQAGRDLKALLSRGDINTSSFAFYLGEKDSTFEREGSKLVHRIKHIPAVVDVSPVTHAAYPQTSVELRTSQQKYERFINAEAENQNALKLKEIEARHAQYERELRLKEIKTFI